MSETEKVRKEPGPKQRRRGVTALQRRRLRVPRAGLHEQAAERLRTLIVRGDLSPGEQLLESDISDALGVSRTPLREALKQLASEGLVELRLNRSAIVRPLLADDVADLFEALSGVERCAAELAAKRMVARDVERLEELQGRIELHHRRGDLREYFEVNQQIHGAIVGFARNRVLKETHEVLLPRAERARFSALAILGRWEESVREHHDILDALKAGDAQRAGQLLGSHVGRTGDILVSSLESAQASGPIEPQASMRVQAAKQFKRKPPAKVDK